jgi:aspartate 1-decarboxylase
MEIQILKSKIHRATVTEANIDYMGSITIDEDLMEAANLIVNEQVHVLNYSNGARIITYVIKGERGSGIICLNGPAALHFNQGDNAVIISYATMNFDSAKTFEPIVIFPDKNNKINFIKYFIFSFLGNMSANFYIVATK